MNNYSVHGFHFHSWSQSAISFGPFNLYCWPSSSEIATLFCLLSQFTLLNKILHNICPCRILLNISNTVVWMMFWSLRWRPSLCDGSLQRTDRQVVMWLFELCYDLVINLVFTDVGLIAAVSWMHWCNWGSKKNELALVDDDGHPLLLLEWKMWDMFGPSIFKLNVPPNILDRTTLW
jgi:hypothetical protein